MRYEGPIYRPPSEADSLLIQATVGCPHNKCTFCMVYKKGPPYRVRPVKDICDHYTNYLDLSGTLPEDKDRLLGEIDRALKWPQSRFRPHFIGNQ